MYPCVLTFTWEGVSGGGGVYMYISLTKLRAMTPLHAYTIEHLFNGNTVTIDRFDMFSFFDPVTK